MRRAARNRDYRIVLECGCAVLSRVQPMSPRERFGCESGQGHGYRLRWASWEGAGSRAENAEIAP